MINSSNSNSLINEDKNIKNYIIMSNDSNKNIMNSE
jgi:hypothetical protein